MEQPPLPRGTPRLLSVVGLSKTGKTTVAEALVRELASRGVRVGAVKITAHEVLRFDGEGTDTKRLWDAGADAVAAISPGGTFRFDRAVTPRDEEGVAGLFRADTDVVVCEGAIPGSFPTIVCLRDLDDLAATLAIRELDASLIAAISGLAAAGAAAGLAIDCGGRMVAVLDVLSPQGRAALADLAASSARAPG